MERKTHLINSLEIAIEALENNTTYYDWKEQDSCNAGIVSQAVLRCTREELEIKRFSIFEKLKNVNDGKNESEKLSLTWRNAIQVACPLTGKTNYEIIEDLEKGGLSKKDIVHLEYLDNPAILSQSGIEKEKREIREIVRYDSEVVKDESSFFKKLFKTTKVESKPVYKITVIEEKYPKNYFTKKENLVKYLKAWVKILKKENVLEMNTRESLEAELLVSLADENYEKASELKNQINNL